MPPTLNPAQQQAVETTEGWLLILAGAGTGKTRVLIERIVYLIDKKGVDPSQIVGLTFTNKAAQEMGTRLSQRLGAAHAKATHLSTFHSLAMQMLRRDIDKLGFTPQFSLYDQQDMARLIRETVKEFNPTLSLATVLPNLIGVRNSSAPLSSLTQEEQDLYTQIEHNLRAYNALDFDGLLILSVELLKSCPTLLDYYRKRYRYILIDEYQDVNGTQCELAALLAGPQGNLCVVGDDDQSIYRFRGADVNHILHFPAHTTIKLERNYRCQPPVLQAANTMIAHNHSRHDKRLTAHKDGNDQLEIFHAPSETQEVQGVIGRLLKLKQRHRLKWSECAILYRSNQLSRLFEIALRQTVWKRDNTFIRGIPYQIFGGTDFFESHEVKDLAAYMRVIANPLDQEALLRIINYPRRGISNQTIDWLTQTNRQNGLSLMELIEQVACGHYNQPPLPVRAQNSLATFYLLLHNVRDRCEQEGLSSGLNLLLEEIAYEKCVINEVKSEQAKRKRQENIALIQQTLIQYEEQEPNPFFADFLAKTQLNQNLYRAKRTTRSDTLSLMTFHSAKGLEFPAVFLVALEDHLLPHAKSSHREALEEERRIFYVALTRSSDHLTLSMSRNRTYQGKQQPTQPSRFLLDIPRQIINPTHWQVT